MKLDDFRKFVLKSQIKFIEKISYKIVTLLKKDIKKYR